MNTLLNGHKGVDCGDGFSTFDVPIFTEEFLDQNKAREAELRRLRKMNVAFEEQNAVLQRHTQSMNSARERLEQELALEERRTLALQQQLQAVRQALTASFASAGARHRGDADARNAGLLHGAASRSHRARPGAARETDRARQGDPGASSQRAPVTGLLDRETPLHTRPGRSCTLGSPDPLK